MTEIYISQSGKKIYIADMADAHLLNAFMHYKKRYMEVKKIDHPDVETYKEYLEDLLITFEKELEQRGIEVSISFD